MQNKATNQLLEALARGRSLSLSLNKAPVEEEELTDEAAASIDRARDSLARGEGVPHEEILREFGLMDGNRRL